MNILYLIFNRLDYAKQSFEGIRAAKPKRLYVFADGPRDNKPGERELCQETRKIIEGVDWDCEVITNFQDENIGMNKANLMALDWYFEHEEDVVFIEDDVLMGPGAAEFYIQMQSKFSKNKEIGFYSGTNVVSGGISSNHYIFIGSVGAWGMATSKAVWQDFREKSSLFTYTQICEVLEQEYSDFPRLLKHYTTTFTRSHLGLIKLPWDLLIDIYCLLYKKICIVSEANLITHIGEVGSHTQQADFIPMPLGKNESLVFEGELMPKIDQAVRKERYKVITALYTSNFIGKVKRKVRIFASIRSFSELWFQVKLIIRKRKENFIILISKLK